MPDGLDMSFAGLIVIAKFNGKISTDYPTGEEEKYG